MNICITAIYIKYFAHRYQDNNEFFKKFVIIEAIIRKVNYSFAKNLLKKH
jgi:hypothetical protein